MNTEQKYYLPDIEDLYVGYQCEMKYSKYNEMMDVTLTKDMIGDYTGQWNDIRYAIEHQDTIDRHHIEVRTKYLDSQDIESEGWVYKWVDTEIFGLEKQYTKTLEIDETTGKFTLMHCTDENRTINVYVKMEDRDYETEDGDRIYNGQCKSKNELRKLMTWLQIK